VYVLFYFFCFWLSAVSAVDCLESLISDMTYYVWSGMLNHTLAEVSVIYRTSLSSLEPVTKRFQNFLCGW